MCKCLAGNVACCCFNCALNVLISIISTFLVIIIIVGLVIYFTKYNEDTKDTSKQLQGHIENSFDKIKDVLSKR